MSAVIVGVIAVVCILVGTIAGLLLRHTLPVHHLTGDSRDAVKIGSGLVATLSALVLALLLNSSKNSFDQMNAAITEGSAKLIMLDRTLARYGPQAQPIRQMLGQSVSTWLTIVWPEQKITAEGREAFEKTTPPMEIIVDKLHELTPQNEAQRTFQAEALQLCKEILQLRWLTFEKAQTSLPPVFLGMLLAWLTILFVSIGLLAPPNKTTVAVLIICAISVGSVVFLIEELNSPLKGMVRISNAPLLKAVETMGK